MKYIEKEYKKFASYLVIYGETEKELNENFAIIKRFSELFEPQLLKRDQIKKILALLNNTGGVMLSDEKKIVIDEDIQFIYDTQPKGISFKEDFYNRMGMGIEHVFM